MSPVAILSTSLFVCRRCSHPLEQLIIHTHCTSWLVGHPRFSPLSCPSLFNVILLPILLLSSYFRFFTHQYNKSSTHNFHLPILPFHLHIQELQNLKWSSLSLISPLEYVSNWMEWNQSPHLTSLSSFPIRGLNFEVPYLQNDDSD